MSYTAKKKNRVLTIPEEKAEEYAKMGYEVTNEDGYVVVEAAIVTVEEARKAANMYAEENKKLRKENENLKGRLDEAEKYAEEAAKRIFHLESENAKLKDGLNEPDTAAKTETATTAKTAKSTKKGE